MTTKDGLPLDRNENLDLPFDGYAYVRKRIGSNVKEEESLTLMNVVDPDYIESSVKLNGISEDFIIDDGGGADDWKVECDIHAADNKISYSEDVHIHVYNLLFI